MSESLGKNSDDGSSPAKDVKAREEAQHSECTSPRRSASGHDYERRERRREPTKQRRSRSRDRSRTRSRDRERTPPRHRGRRRAQSRTRSRSRSRSRERDRRERSSRSKHRRSRWGSPGRDRESGDSHAGGHSTYDRECYDRRRGRRYGRSHYDNYRAADDSRAMLPRGPRMTEWAQHPRPTPRYVDRPPHNAGSHWTGSSNSSRADAGATDPSTGDRATAEASNWVQEKTPDGQPCWRNVRTLEMSWSRPLSWRHLDGPPPVVWQKEHNEHGLVQFRNKETGEVIVPSRAPARQSEKHRKDTEILATRGTSRRIAASETATGKQLLQYTPAELAERRGHLGSTRSLLDRQKYYRDFFLLKRVDGAAEIRWRRRPGNPVVTTIEPELVPVYVGNPHLHQVFANGRELQRPGRALGVGDRIARKDFEPRSPYTRRQGEVKTVEHWGQRKLLMSEIEFLTRFAAEAKTVVYAGAAPGDHLEFLAKELFPELRWVLVDPAPFVCRPSDKIIIKQDYFTDELAKSLAEEDGLLFICDVRSMDVGMNDAEKENRVAADMLWQQQWVKLMKPQAAMLKFRLPYATKDDTESSTTYLDGDVYLPCWGGRTTTETRLVVTDPEAVREYNHKVYEDYMFHFNTVTRTTYFEHNVDGVPGLDHCFDCASEVLILKQYLAYKHEETLTEEALAHHIKDLVQRISAQCSSTNRTLALPDVARHATTTLPAPASSPLSSTLAPRPGRLPMPHHHHHHHHHPHHPHAPSHHQLQHRRYHPR